MRPDVEGRTRPEILLVEDNENDVILMQEGFKLANVAINLQHVQDGKACMAYLRKQEPYADAPTPDLILLDLNMPMMDGREVMEQVVADDHLSHIPVVVLTTSSAEMDILAMYKLRCNSYIIKPADFGEFLNIIRLFSEYWLTTVTLPPTDPPPFMSA